jgi:DNA-binding CsgD family transcriptional regulator
MGTVFQRFLHQHPWQLYVRRNPQDGAVKLSDLISVRQFQNLDLYNEYYRVMGVNRQCGIALPVPPPTFIPIALNRSGQDFSERDRLLLTLIGPHLHQAFNNTCALAALNDACAALSRSLERCYKGVMVLSRDSRIDWITDRARILLGRYCGDDRLTARRLPARCQQWLSHQRARWSASDTVPSPLMPFDLHGELGTLTIRLLPEPDRDVLLFEEHRAAGSHTALNMDGLTHRETDVLHWVAQGKSNFEIGAILDLSPRTIQKHLERVFLKLGVENRTSAAMRYRELVERLQMEA